MADINVKVPIDLDWLPTDLLELFVGDENVADLAASDPAGGERVSDRPPWEGSLRGGLGMDPLGTVELGFTATGHGLGDGELGYGALGVNDMPRAVLEHAYDPTDICGVLALGVKVADEHDNRSSVSETLVGLSDRPKGARGLTLASTGNTHEARLSWTQSPGV